MSESVHPRRLRRLDAVNTITTGPKDNGLRERPLFPVAPRSLAIGDDVPLRAGFHFQLQGLAMNAEIAEVDGRVEEACCGTHLQDEIKGHRGRVVTYQLMVADTLFAQIVGHTLQIGPVRPVWSRHKRKFIFQGRATLVPAVGPERQPVGADGGLLAHGQGYRGRQADPANGSPRSLAHPACQQGKGQKDRRSEMIVQL